MNERPKMQVFLVKFKGREAKAIPNRGSAYAARMASSKAFESRLEDWLAQNHLSNQVAAIGKPTVFPVIQIFCTPEVAHQIATLEDVDSVTVDTPSMGLVR